MASKIFCPFSAPFYEIYKQKTARALELQRFFIEIISLRL